eukprot:jgi/Astpho2/8869/fgenesh1_pm.00129_%23_13_t
MSKPDWFSQPCFMGIDEAGRGPVLGPMVYGAAVAPLALQTQLAGMSFADSKTLTEAKREDMFAEIAAHEHMASFTDVLTAQQLSARMLSRERTSLNALASESTVRLIEECLESGAYLREVYVDTVGDAERWRAKLADRFPYITFMVCPKADAIYPIVSAASIVAKVTRDRLLREFQPQEAGVQLGTQYGSGYPGDPVTKQWLDSHMDPVFGFPSLVRFSWQTADRMLEDRAASVKWECEAEDIQQQQLTFQQNKQQSRKASSGQGRHAYFRARKLQRITEVF